MFDDESKADLKRICDVVLSKAMKSCDQLKREDVFYVPVIMIAAIRAEGDETNIIGCDVAFEDGQPTDGIAKVLSNVSSVLRGEQPPGVASVNKIIAEGAKLS
jgi:hypothetical protein